MRRLTFLFLIITVKSFGQVGPEDYAVYSIIINEKLRTDSISNKSIIIVKTTATKMGTESIQESIEWIKLGQPIFCSYPDNINELITQEPEIKYLLLRLDTIKDNKVILSPNLNLDCEYRLITKSKFGKILKKDLLVKLKRERLGLFGMIEFSNVAFNGDYAAVYYGQYKGGFNAVGTLIVLKKDNGQWKIISKPEIWIS